MPRGVHFRRPRPWMSAAHPARVRIVMTGTRFRRVLNEPTHSWARLDWWPKINYDRPRLR
jgi:hypothetical protein